MSRKTEIKKTGQPERPPSLKIYESNTTSSRATKKGGSDEKKSSVDGQRMSLITPRIHGSTQSHVMMPPQTARNSRNSFKNAFGNDKTNVT